jgi:hypothetical protein
MELKYRAGSYAGLKIMWCEAGVLGDAGKHFRADFIGVVERPSEVRVARPLELLMRTSFYEVMFHPADREKGFVNPSRF